MAGDPGAAILLFAMGYDSLSMNVTNLPKVKSIMRAVTRDEAQQLLEKVRAMKRAQEIREVVYEVLKKKGVTRLYRDPVKQFR